MKRTSVKIVVFLVVFIGIVLAGLLYFLNYKLEDYVRSKLAEQLDPSWQVTFQELSVSLFSMSFDVESLALSRSDSLGLFWKASMEKASVDGIHPLQILFSSELIAEAVKLHDLEVEMHRFNQKQNSKSKKKYGSLSLIVEKIILDDGHVSFENDLAGYFDCRIEFETNQIKFNKAFNNPLELSEKISLKLSDLSYIDPDSANKITMKQLTKERNGKIVLDSLIVDPLMSLKEFSEHHGWSKSLYTFKVKQILARIPEMTSDSVYQISKIQIIEPTFKLEKAMSHGLPNRKTTLPQEKLLALGISFDLDSLLVENGKMEIRLQQENGMVAELILGSIYAHAGAQNDIQDSVAFFFSADATALKGSSLSVRSHYLYGYNNPWNLSGSLSDTDLQFLSDFLQKMAGVEVISGQLDKLEFDMRGNDQINTGMVTFLYDNLGIRAVNKETGKKKVFLNVITDALGALVFWRQNPKDGNVRTGIFFVERDIRKAFPSQWIDGLLAGVLESVSKIDPAKIRRNSKKDKVHQNKEK